MRIKAKDILPKKVTIVNRLLGVDNDSGKDIFYKKTLKDCMWDDKQISSRNGNNITFTDGYRVQIPQNQEFTYFPYSVWKNNENLEDCFTLSVDDVIILGEVKEEITPSNITEIIDKYKPNAFRIRQFHDLTFNGINTKGIFLNQYASILSIEGVWYVY